MRIVRRWGLRGGLALAAVAAVLLLAGCGPV